MPIPTDVTIEDSFSVLDPLDVAPPGSNIEAYVEEAVTQLTMGQQVHSIVFAVQKASLNYHFDEEQVRNTVDATPRVLSWIITNKTVDGFEVTLSGTPDTGNYYFSWKVRIPTALTNNVIITAESAGSGGTVTRVDATASSGLTAVVTNATTSPTIAMDISNGGIPLAKLAQSVVVDDGTVTHNSAAQTLTNKGIDGNNNTLTNIGLASLSGNGIIAQGLSDPGSDQGVTWDYSAGNFRFLGTPSSRGVDKHVYLSLRGDGNGIGTLDDPYDATIDFDAIMSDSSETPAGASIHLLGNGVYSSKGFTARSGWKFYAGQATIRLPVLTVGEAAGFVAIFGGSSNALTQDILIDGGIWDMNTANQTQVFHPQAVQLVCNGLTIRNSKFINFGNPQIQECFLVGNFTEGSRDSIIHDRGCLYENLEFTSPASITNVGTITLLGACGGQNLTSNTSLSNGWFKNVTVRGCWFHDITFADAVSVISVNLGGAVQNFHAHSNRFTNLSGAATRYAYYWDTGPGINIKIENDQLDTVRSGVFFIPDAAVPIRKTVSIESEMMTTVEIPVHYEENAGPSFNVAVNNNTILSPGGSASVFVSNTNGVRIFNNLIDSSDAINTSGSTNIARFGNKHTDGTPVTGEGTLLATGAGHTVDDVITALQGQGVFRQS